MLIERHKFLICVFLVNCKYQLLMDHHSKEKNLELDRLVFFSDAVVAIAITLLALNLKISKAIDAHLTFADFAASWQNFLAFFLSFLIIAVFWKIHHEFFVFIKEISEALLLYNIGWLLFIVLLPFTTTLISAHFSDTAAMFAYSFNIFMITLFQNLIWDYVAIRPQYTKDNLTPEINKDKRIACNIAMVNGLIAMVFSFISPAIAFFILFTRLLMFKISSKFFYKRKTQIIRQRQSKPH
jgi:uncharacterized membrane protein